MQNEDIAYFKLSRRLNEGYTQHSQQSPILKVRIDAGKERSCTYVTNGSQQRVQVGEQVEREGWHILSSQLEDQGRW